MPPQRKLCYTVEIGVLRRFARGVAMVVSPEVLAAVLGALVALVALVQKLIDLMQVSGGA